MTYEQETMGTDLVTAVGEELDSLGVRQCKVVVAVSGGPDSVALLRSLHALRLGHQLELIVAHFNHRLREPACHEDERFVVALAEELALPCAVGTADRDHSERSDRSETIEEWARKCRYDFLVRTAAQHAAPYIATGHTSDDQAETVLHRIVRGTGLAGLTGIPVRRKLNGVSVIRPMLQLSRDQVLDWLRAGGYGYRLDAMNEDPRFTRNRIRHEVMPLLRELNPRVREALCRLSSVAAEVVAILEPLVVELEQRCLLNETPERVILSVPALERAPGLLVREVFRRIWSRHGWPEKQMSFEHWHHLAGLVHGAEGAWDLPGGVRARRLRGTVILERVPAAETTATAAGS